MMVFTHLTVSLAAAALVLPAAPGGVAPATVFIVGVIGGVAPDLDLPARHRRTLHYPIVFALLAVALLGVFAVSGGAAWFLGGLLFISATLHTFLDLLAGSAERAPWDPTTGFGVYNHVLGRWHRPVRAVGYSGSPGDFLVGAGAGAVAVAAPATTVGVDVAIVCLVGLAGGYSRYRKRLSELVLWANERLPPRARRLLPMLSVEEPDGGGSSLRIRFNR